MLRAWPNFDLFQLPDGKDSTRPESHPRVGSLPSPCNSLLPDSWICVDDQLMSIWRKIPAVEFEYVLDTIICVLNHVELLFLFVSSRVPAALRWKEAYSCVGIDRNLPTYHLVQSIWSINTWKLVVQHCYVGSHLLWGHETIAPVAVLMKITSLLGPVDETCQVWCGPGFNAL